MKMALFELSLLMLPVVKILQDSDTTATEKEIENIAKHIRIADQVILCLIMLRDSIESFEQRNFEPIIHSFYVRQKVETKMKLLSCKMRIRCHREYIYCRTISYNL